MPRRSHRRSAKNLFAAVRNYTGGMRPAEIKQLFDREAANAYSVLARDHVGQEPRGGFPRFLYRLRILFLGFSYRLTPSRRALFVASLFVAFLGLIDFGFDLSLIQGRVNFDASPLWFVFSIAGLSFLLALELVDQVRVRDELEVARQLQRDLLPAEAPELHGYRICHTYRTANEVGGDYYDFQPLADGRLAILVGDASGHGMAAGLLMAIANATLKLAIDLDPRPLSVLALLNRTLVQTGDRRAFMSLFYCILDPLSGDLEYATAGHPYPFLRHKNGAVSELGSGGLPLGIRPLLDPHSGQARLEHGDLLVLYSDGLPEATNENDESFGYDRLSALVQKCQHPEQVRDSLLRAVDQHLAGQAIEDDFSLVVLGREIPLPPIPSLENELGAAQAVPPN